MEKDFFNRLALLNQMKSLHYSHLKASYTIVRNSLPYTTTHYFVHKEGYKGRFDGRKCNNEVQKIY